nr:MerR family transcriptional regulator [Hyphomicrobiales bacterium]
MSSSALFLSASEAAGRLGVSVKALRLYEQRGMIRPLRTEAGWRVYGPEEMAKLSEIVTLRGLGLSLVQIAPLLNANSDCLETALAAHQAVLDERLVKLADM